MKIFLINFLKSISNTIYYFVSYLLAIIFKLKHKNFVKKMQFFYKILVKKNLFRVNILLLMLPNIHDSTIFLKKLLSLYEGFKLSWFSCI